MWFRRDSYWANDIQSMEISFHKVINTTAYYAALLRNMHYFYAFQEKYYETEDQLAEAHGCSLGVWNEIILPC